MVAHDVYRSLRKRAGGNGGRDAGLGVGYKALALEDQDGDRAPMINDPS